jgi:hypothetical protein
LYLVTVYTLKREQLTQEEAKKMLALYSASHSPRPANPPADYQPLFGVLPRPENDKLLHLVRPEKNGGGIIMVRDGNPTDKAWLVRISEECEPWVKFSPIQEMESLEDFLSS